MFPKFEKINGGKDYVYYLDNRDEVYKRVRWWIKSLKKIKC